MAAGKMKGQTELEQDTVDVWRVNLDIAQNKLQELLRLLSQDEIARAERLKSDELRNRFIAARGFLRSILSRYTGQDPKDIVFSYNQAGKPGLANSQIQFNLSHSKDIALYAVALNRAVGIDIETIDNNADHLKLAKEFFSEQESRHISCLPPEQQKKGFYQAWTRKEAIAKAKGICVLKLLEKDYAAHNWFLSHLEFGQCIGTMAVEGQDIEVRNLTLS